MRPFETERVIPAEILASAAEILLQQTFVPTSPGQIDGAQVTFCTAAAIALSGADFYSRPEVKARVKQAMALQDKLSLDESFQQLGWPRALCEHIRLMNDAVQPKDRKRIMVDRLCLGSVTL